MPVATLPTAQTDVNAMDKPEKLITFQLLPDPDPSSETRLWCRRLQVSVNAHNTSESTVAATKNFYGMDDRRGISFLDAPGNKVIPSYENLSHDRTVYMRVVPDPYDGGTLGPSSRQQRGHHSADISLVCFFFLRLLLFSSRCLLPRSCVADCSRRLMMTRLRTSKIG
jgi:hypothetical protein